MRLLSQESEPERLANETRERASANEYIRAAVVHRTSRVEGAPGVLSTDWLLAIEGTGECRVHASRKRRAELR